MKSKQLKIYVKYVLKFAARKLFKNLNQAPRMFLSMMTFGMMIFVLWIVMN
jgi:hypothetical protein